MKEYRALAKHPSRAARAGGESASSVRMVIQEYLAPVIIGRDPRNCSEIALAMQKAVRGNPFARAALEVACFDIAGQSIGVPAAQLLGGTQRQTVPMVWSLASGVVDQEIEEALKANEDFGFTLFKVKVGYSKPAVALSRVDRLVRALPDNFQIRLDANQGWNEMTAAWMLPRLSDIGITVLEQPIARCDLEGMARLKRLGQVAMMADEAAMNPNDQHHPLRIGRHDRFEGCEGRRHARDFAMRADR